MQYKPGELTAKLYEAMELVPSLTTKPEIWESLIINRRKPYTYRVFTTLPNGLRLCLHKFDPCHTHEAFAHPHPWPGAFTVMYGSYQMNIGYSTNRNDKPEVFGCPSVVNIELTRFSSYEIIDPLTWHSVVPLETTYTIMINDTPWSSDVAHTDVRTTKGKDLDKMPEGELLEHLAKFRIYSMQWLIEKDTRKNDNKFHNEMQALIKHNEDALIRERVGSPYDASVKRV